MQDLSWKLIEKLDAVCDDNSDICGFLYTVGLSSFSNEDNAQRILGFAKVLGVDPAKMGQYLWFQVYIRELSESFGDVPLREVVAQFVGLRYNRRFRQYIDRRAEQARLFRCQAIESDSPPQVLLHERRSFEDELDEEDLLKDLQDDGGYAVCGE